MSFGLARGKPLDITGIGISMHDLPDFDDQPVIDPRTFFDNPEAPLQIEIGSGKGTFLVQQAGAAPQTNFLGIEWAGEFFRYAADRIRRNGLTNVRLLHTDAIEIMSHRFPHAIADVIHLYFPDPWPKKRHHKRRSIQDQTLPVFHQILAPRGELRIVTDHDDYWQWIHQRALRADSLFEQHPFRPADATATAGEVVGTNFERKYRRQGRPFHAIVLRRI